MRTQEQTLRVYYAAMSDAELLDTAANKGSFLPVAQRLLDAELRRRKLAEEPQVSPSLPAHPHWPFGALRGLRHAFRH